MDLRESLRCQTDVALTITKHLFSKQEYQDKNLMFSPLSLHVVLSIMAAGSQGNTLDELLSFLRSDSIDHLTTFFSHLVSAVLSNVASPSSHHLSFVNGIWVDKSISISHYFKQLVATHYQTSLSSVDFQTKGDQVCHEVNSWVERDTKGLITELFPPEAVDKLTRLVCANALSFKGEWKHKFDASCNNNFYLLNGTSIKVPFMSNGKKTQFIRTFDSFKVLRLSYKQGRDKNRRFSMYIFLPDAKDGLPALIVKLASEPGFLKSKFPRRKVRVCIFKIPKFKISFTLEASNLLKELGVVSPFSQWDADFTKMVNSPSEGVYVESMFHKASIEVDEQGTKATAAAGSLLRNTYGVPAGIDFIANHPFLFVIREDLAGTILFIGQVLNPLDGAYPLVKEDLREKHRACSDKAEEEEESRDFELEENGGEEDEDDDDDDKPEVPPKSKMARTVDELEPSVRRNLLRLFHHMQKNNYYPNFRGLYGCSL